MTLYKIVGFSDNLYFDYENKRICFLNPIFYVMEINVINPYKYNSDDYNIFNYYVIEILKLYDDDKRKLFENHIKNMIKNKNYIGLFNGVNFSIEKSYLCLNDFKLIN